MNSTVTNSPYSINFDAYLVKYNAKGSILWAKQWYSLDTSDMDVVYSPATVAADDKGNVYLNANFPDTLLVGSYTIINNDGYQATCIAKYDSNGNLKWIKASRNSGNGSLTGSVGNQISSDNFGNVFLLGTGSYDTVHFDTSIVCYRKNVNANDFLVKYDSAGNVKWAKESIPHGGGGVVSYCMANDRFGNIYTAGGFGDTVQYGANILIDAFWGLYGDFEIVKWDSSGNVLWAKEAKKISNSCSGVGFGVTADRNGNVYACGDFINTLIFGQDTVKDTVAGRQNFFVVKYDPNGNVIWAKQATILDSNYGWGAWSMSSDNHDHLYLSINGGFGKSKIAFGGDTLIFNDTSKNDGASIIFKLDSNGKALCGTIIPAGTGWATPGFRTPISSDTSGKYIYLGGTAGTPAIFGKDTVNPYCIPINHIQGRNCFPFVARWEACDSSIFQAVPEEQKPLGGVVVYPNPNNGSFTIALQNVNEPAQVEIYNMLGEKVQSEKLNANNARLEMTSPASGVYFYRVIQENGSFIGSGKFVIEK